MSTEINNIFPIKDLQERLEEVKLYSTVWPKYQIQFYQFDGILEITIQTKFRKSFDGIMYYTFVKQNYRGDKDHETQATIEALNLFNQEAYNMLTLAYKETFHLDTDQRTEKERLIDEDPVLRAINYGK